MTDPYLEENLRKMYEEKRAPVLTIEDGWVVYMAFSDAENNFYIGGPVIWRRIRKKKADCIITGADISFRSVN